MKNLTKKTKLFIMIYLVLSFITLVLALGYSTKYSNMHIYYRINSKGTVVIDEAQEMESGVSNKNLFTYFAADASQVADDTVEDKPFMDEINAYYKKNGTSGNVENFITGAEYNGSTMAKTIYNFQNSLSDYNQLILYYFIVFIIAVAVLFIFSNHSRKIYYKSNLVVGVAIPAVIVIFSIIMLVQNFSIMSTVNKNFKLFQLVDLLMDRDCTTKMADNLAYNYQTKGDISGLMTKGEANMTFYIALAIYAIVILYSVFIAVLTIVKYKEGSQRRAEIEERMAQEND